MKRLALLMIVVLGCTGAPGGSPAGPPAASGDTSAPGTDAGGELTLMTHDSFALPDELLEAFGDRHGVSLRVLRAGDAGSMLNQALLSRDDPLADVLFGVDDTFLSRALDAALFEPYASPGLAQVPDALELDPRRRVTPIDYGDVCLNLDRSAFADGDPTAPATLDDLADPAYRGMLVVENPATSSPGLAHLLATIALYGEDGDHTWRDHWGALRDNDVLVTDGWEDAYYGRFSGGAGEGDRPIVVSYASSPAAEVVFAESPPDEAPTVALLEGCYRQTEFAGILRGTDQPEAAKALIDFLLSTDVQSAIPLSMFVYPARGDVELPEAFRRHARQAPEPLSLPYERIGAERERWIREWTRLVLG
jgi:thiamine transport system substrate-binding protein